MINKPKKDDDNFDELGPSESPAAVTPTSVSPEAHRPPLPYVDTSIHAGSKHVASQPPGMEDSGSGVLVSAYTVQ